MGSHYKGVQEQVLGPGRYFFDPVEYEWQVVDQVKIPAGEPDRWEFDESGNLKDPSAAPMVAIISLKQGKANPLMRKWCPMDTRACNNRS